MKQRRPPAGKMQKEIAVSDSLFLVQQNELGLPEQKRIAMCAMDRRRKIMLIEQHSKKNAPDAASVGAPGAAAKPSSRILEPRQYIERMQGDFEFKDLVALEVSLRSEPIRSVCPHSHPCQQSQ
jgi:hypothetical protein